MALRPKSPNERSEPRHALPFMRPRCCLRYLTFFGNNITEPSYPRGPKPRRYSLAISEASLRPSKSLRGECARRDTLVATLLLLVDVATIDPGLDADDAVRRVRLGEAVVDVGAQRMQRQTALEVPLRAGDLVSVQTAGDANLDALATEAESRVHALTHGATEADALLKL